MQLLKVGRGANGTMLRCDECAVGRSAQLDEILIVQRR
jgi:hypothetical protein